MKTLKDKVAAVTGAGSGIGRMLAVNLAKEGEANFPGFTEMLLASCASLVERSERFAQTGAGWVLRELSQTDPGAVIAFVQAHRSELSREAFDRATGRLPTEIVVQLREQG